MPQPSQPDVIAMYEEFRLLISVDDLTDASGDDESEQFKSLFKMLGVTPFRAPLPEIYGGVFDFLTFQVSGPNYAERPGDFLVFLADQDKSTFIAVDLVNLDAADWRSMIELFLRVPIDFADKTAAVLTSIRQNATHAGDYTSPVSRGQLHLENKIAAGQFPRFFDSDRIRQDLRVFQHGQICYHT